jgi:hypothetical protein
VSVGGTMIHPELPTDSTSPWRVVMDFDGLLAEGTWPSPRIGKPIGRGIAILIYYANQGREIIIHTARPESHKERIWAWLRMSSLQDHVYDVVCGKPVADIYIDDKAWNPWKEEGESAASSSVPSFGSAPSKAASPSPYPYRTGGNLRAEDYTNTGAVNG